MGDFNLTPESKEYQKMNEQFQSSHQVFYKKEPQIAFPTDPTGTFDYIWLRGENIEVKDFQIFGDNKIEEGVYPSDHYGLFGVYKL